MITVLKTSEGEIIRDYLGMPIYEESSLVPPDGCGTGALVRDDLPGESGPLFHDVFRRDIIDQDDWPELIKRDAGNQKRYVNWIYHQQSVGSCASEGLHGCVDSNRERRGMKRVKFNPYVLYYFSSGGRDIGSSLTENIRQAKSRGMMPDALWPRSQHRWNDVPPSSHAAWREAAKYKPDEVYDIGNWVEAASALFLGHSVYAAYPGHAWQLIRVLNTQQAEWRNSWGDTWDGDGYGVISASQITFQYGLFAIPSSTADA